MTAGDQECPLFFVISEREGRPQAIAFNWDSGVKGPCLLDFVTVCVTSLYVTVVFKVRSREPLGGDIKTIFLKILRCRLFFSLLISH